MPRLRQLWQHTCAADTAALVETLLARDWVALDPAPHRSREPGVRPVAGLGYARADTDDAPRAGSIAGEAGADLQWLYLINPDAGSVAVYEATVHDRWARHSMHDLACDTDGDLFASHPGIHCLTCGAIDLVDHRELPSMTGSGFDTYTRCLRCGATEAVDPMFGRHPAPVTWPSIRTPRSDA